MANFKGKAAIAGYGATEFSKNSGRSELKLATEAALAACADAGIDPKEIDGISTYTMDNNNEQEVARAIGSTELKFFGETSGGGGGACAPLLQAAMAVATGVADTVLCYRAMNERSEYRFGQPIEMMAPTSDALIFGYHGFQGLSTAAALLAVSMRRYMHESGATQDDFCNYAMTARKHAARNPAAFFYGKPITREEYHASRMIADPFHLLDCCQESDGACAVIVTSAERARDLKQPAVLIQAAAQGSPWGTMGLGAYYKQDIVPRDECAAAARQLWATSGLSPKDMQLAIIYDHFGPTVLPGLEAYGFCAYGEAKDFIKDGNIEVGGTLPVNTNGGQLGEAYIHGMNGVCEAVRQIRGTAVNQVADVENALVTAGSGVPTSAVVLSRDV